MLGGSRDENCPQPALVAPGPSLLSFQFVQLGSLRCLGRGFPHFPTEICGDHGEMWGISWRYGYGSIPIDTIFCGLFTSINRYFHVNKKGVFHGF